MSNLKARLETAGHIFIRVLSDKLPDLRKRKSKIYENYGVIDFRTKEDFLNFDVNEIERSVQSIISLDMDVKVEHTLKPFVRMFRGKLKMTNSRVTIVSVGAFDSRICKKNHVSNTSEIGVFAIDSVKEVRRNRYNVRFSVN
jgi:Ser-tRNA(Ala) deacylase AlaX